MKTATCPKCGRTVRRSSTPMVGEGKYKQFWQHQDPEDPAFWVYYCPKDQA